MRVRLGHSRISLGIPHAVGIGGFVSGERVGAGSLRPGSGGKGRRNAVIIVSLVARLLNVDRPVVVEPSLPRWLRLACTGVHARKKRGELGINVIIVRRARGFVHKGEFGQIQIVRQRDRLFRDIDRLDFGRFQPRASSRHPHGTLPVEVGIARCVIRP